MRIIAVICLLTLTACATPPSPKSQADCVKNYSTAAKWLLGPIVENYTCSGNPLPQPVK